MRHPPPAPTFRALSGRTGPHRAARWSAGVLAAAAAVGCADPASPSASGAGGAALSFASTRDSLRVGDTVQVAVQLDSAHAAGGVTIAAATASATDTAALAVRVDTATPSVLTLRLIARATGRVGVGVTARLSDGSTASATTNTITIRGPYDLAVWPDTNALVPGLVRPLEARDMTSPYSWRGSAGVRWTSDAPSVATVDSAGRVTAVGAGQATITATSRIAGVERRATSAVFVRAYAAPLAFTSLVGASATAFFPVLSTHTCGLTADGRAYCWGENATGNLGTAGASDRCETITYSTMGHSTITTRSTFRCSAVPVEVDGGLRFAQLSTYGSSYANTYHTCGATAGGDVYCWGQNPYGQFGTGGTTSSASPLRADAAVRFRAVSVGSGFTCALAVDGTPYCWGRNSPPLGNLGAAVPGLLCTGDTAAVVPLPRPVVNVPRLVSITTGDTHACGLAADGTAWCWGDNIAGQLGNGRPQTASCASQSDTTCYAFSASPTRVAGATTFREVRAGHNSTCALDAAGALWCWGLTGVGTRETVFAGLADGLVSRVPAQFPGAPALRALASPPWGDVQFSRGSCGLGLDARLNCFSHSAVTIEPAGPAALQFAQVASVGWPYYGNAACGLGTDGVAYCWYAAAVGARGDGQLSSGPADLTGVPARVVGQR